MKIAITWKDGYYSTMPLNESNEKNYPDAIDISDDVWQDWMKHLNKSRDWNDYWMKQAKNN